MLEYIVSILPISLAIIMASALVSWVVLKIICLASPNFLSLIYISSGKSATNARLLGGLAISASLITAICMLLLIYPKSISLLETHALIVGLASIALVTFYGYIDDKFEVRVRYKLSLQLVSVLAIAYFNAENISADHPTLAFIFSSILGLALVNGTNLLDGLDTLSIKLGACTSLAFLYLGFVSNSPTTVFLSLAMMAALASFYFFNKEPAKVYMGEIGGSLIGLIYFIQSSLCFSHLKIQMSMTNALAVILIAGGFPIFELGISFLRRILCKKTPFRGDKLHLHYILKNQYKLTASQASTRMGLACLLIYGLAFIAAKTYGPHLALEFALAVTMQGYLTICLNEWRASNAQKSLQNVFKMFEGKKVNVIDSTQFSSIDISLSDDVKTKKSA